MERRTIGSLGQGQQGRWTVDQQGRCRTINWQGRRTVKQSQFQLQIIGSITNQICLPYHVSIGLQFRRLQRQS